MNACDSSFSYVHDGSEADEDSFVMAVSDSRNKFSRVVPVVVDLVDDDSPQVLDSLQTGLQVMEGGDVPITPHNLAVLDNDTNDLDLMFTVWKSPEFGNIEVEGHRSSEFSQYDIKQGLVRYVHTDGEVGPEPKEDTVLFSVRDLGAPDPVKGSLMELHFTIEPVNTENPEVILGSPMLALEGETTTITTEVISARDLDTLEETLTFIVTQPPRWGYLDNTKPLRGSEISREGIPITQFAMRDLMDQTVRYVQSNHSGTEPVQDKVKLYVTDGERESRAVWLHISIVPRNDELPRLRLGDLVVEEGGEKVVDPVMIDGHDMDNHENDLMLSLDEAPQHGELSLMMELQGHMQETPMHDVSMHDVHYRMHLKYKHDGSENYRDQFTLKLTDGVHSTRGTSKIKVMPINDERPQLLTNTGISVKYGQHRKLSSVVLESTDGDNSENELYYIVIKGPEQGMLEKVSEMRALGPSQYWAEVPAGDNFTQYDVDMNNVRYTHTGGAVRGDASKDSFVFQVTDGMNVLQHETFNIEIAQTGESDLALLNKGMDVKEGESRILSTEVLSASDNTDRAQDIIFVVITPPQNGRLEMAAEPGTAISQFTQLDLAAQIVLYVHTGKRDVPFDSFEFQVITSANYTRTAIFTINVATVDEALPTIVANVPLTVLQGEEIQLTTSNLQITDLDTSPRNLTYTVVEGPRHGRLLKQDIPLDGQTFTQQDIDMGFMKYKSNRSDDSGNFDYFLFTVSDGHHEGYLNNGTVVTKPVFFNILIQPLTQEPPRMVSNKSPTHLDYNGDDEYSYVLKTEHLQAVHAGSETIDIVYVITQKPEHGILHHLATKRMIRKRFTQKDVDDGNVLYVLEGDVQAYNDSFAFRVQNGFGNALPEQR